MVEIDIQTKLILERFGFEPSKGQSKLFEKKVDDETIAYVDFRKVDGRRFARRNDEFVEDEDSIEILKQFKEERDKLQSSSVGTNSEVPSDHINTSSNTPDMGRENISGKSPILPSNGASNPTAPTFDYIKEIVGDDLLEIFGDTGTGKSKFVHALALEAINSGKKVFFLDTERNLSKQDIEKLGDAYHYTPVFKEIKNLVLKNLPKVDMVIIDSVGLPILTIFATLDMKERGNALLELIAVVGKLKEWAYENKAIAVITNQPESEFGKSADTIRKPFGDKACFAAKEIWVTKKLKSGLGSTTKCSIESFRSRSMKSGLSIMQIDISDSGTKITK